MKVLVHVVTFNSEQWIELCLRSLEKAWMADALGTIEVLVTDNASSDASVPLVRDFIKDRPWIKLAVNAANLGFCGAHNQGAKRFLDGDRDVLLILNPDCALESDAIARMSHAAEGDPKRGLITPLLYRSDEQLHSLGNSNTVDAAGMILTSSLRHFDRGAGEALTEEMKQPGRVFGGTGACLMLTRHFVQDALLEGSLYERDIEKLYPALSLNRSERVPLFDEGFFAYREDADLCWRAHLLGWKCFYAPSAVGYHRRRVVPENRSSLPQVLNQLGVRNRFLLQIQNYVFRDFPGAFFPGFIVRNIVVIIGVLFWERKSLPALREIVVLWRRAWERRRTLQERRKERGYERVSWPRDCEACSLG